jgi:hypothetical protein
MYNKKEHAYWPPLCGMGFYEYEINRMQRIFYVMRDTHIEDIDQNRKDFVKFVDEHDRRRGTNFLKTFPEMEEFYFNCRNLI